MLDFFKNSKEITLSALTNSNRWVNILEALLGFAIAGGFGAITWSFFEQYKIPTSILTLGYSVFIMIGCVIILEKIDPNKNKGLYKEKTIIWSAISHFLLILVFIVINYYLIEFFNLNLDKSINITINQIIIFVIVVNFIRVIAKNINNYKINSNSLPKDSKPKDFRNKISNLISKSNIRYLLIINSIIIVFVIFLVIL